MTWLQLITKLRGQDLKAFKSGNNWYLRYSRKTAENDWHGEIEGSPFHVILSPREKTCFLKSKEAIPSLEEALKKVLKMPETISGINQKENLLVNGVIFAKSIDLLKQEIRTKEKEGFIPSTQLN